nr:immunoglobulin light chain junction region [Macaca mulatta]
CQQYNSFPFIF